jgi:hypothetical protein
VIWKINHAIEADKVAAGSLSFLSGLESANCHCEIRDATFARSQQQFGHGFVSATCRDQNQHRRVIENLKLRINEIQFEIALIDANTTLRTPMGRWDDASIGTGLSTAHARKQFMDCGSKVFLR